MSTDEEIYAKEMEFIGIKTKLDDFIKEVNNEPCLYEFSKHINTMYQNMQESFSRISFMQRTIHDVKRSLDKNMRDKIEGIKSVEEDSERLMNLKSEFENYYLKIDQAKFEETEKDKKIKELNEKIVKLNQLKDQENFSNLKPKEMDMKQKLILESEELDFKISTKEDRRRQLKEILDRLMEENLKGLKETEEYQKEYSTLTSKVMEHDEILKKEKEAKVVLENKFETLKIENGNKKKDLEDKIHQEEELKLEEEQLHNELEELEDQKKKTQKEIMEYRTNKIPKLKPVIEENKKKIKVLDEQIGDIVKEIQIKEKEQKFLKNESAKYAKLIKEKEDQNDEVGKELGGIKETIKKKEEEIERMSSEIRKYENVLSQKLSLQMKNQKFDDDKNRKLKGLANDVYEIEKQILALGNSTRRMDIEIRGMKRETFELDIAQANAEKEKNYCAKLASDANMDYTQALEKLKKLNDAISDLKDKNFAADAKLKQQKKIYDALKADSKRFEKKYAEALKEIKEIEEDKTKKEAKYHALKKDLIFKQDVIRKTEEKLSDFQEIVERHEKEKKELSKECEDYSNNIVKYTENINSLKKMISTAETDLQNQKKEMGVVVSERDFIAEQLIQRSGEIKSLYEKIKSLQSEELKMHQTYEKLLLEIEKNKTTKEFLFEEYTKTENIIKNIFDLKVVKIKLEKEVLVAKNKVRSLEDELKTPLNIHRWTKLEYSDPEKFELISQINSLQRRLIAKTEEVKKKEELIEEKEKLYVKLKHIVARQTAIGAEDQLVKYKTKIKEETERLKKHREKIKENQMEIRNYEYEIKRITNELERLKGVWYDMMNKIPGNSQSDLIPAEDFKEDEVEDGEIDENNYIDNPNQENPTPSFSEQESEEIRTKINSV